MTKVTQDYHALLLEMSFCVCFRSLLINFCIKLFGLYDDK